MRRRGLGLWVHGLGRCKFSVVAAGGRLWRAGVVPGVQSVLALLAGRARPPLPAQPLGWALAQLAAPLALRHPVAAYLTG